MLRWNDFEIEEVLLFRAQTEGIGPEIHDPSNIENNHTVGHGKDRCRHIGTQHPLRRHWPLATEN